MTLLLLGAGALLAALGTRAAGLAFASAAVLAVTGITLAAPAAWTAATALGLVALRASPRRLAVPVLGAAAALAVGSARNTAVVAAVWVLATAAAVISRGRGAEGDRWAMTVCLADVPLLGAVVWTALRVGFEGWPQELDTVGVLLLLLAATLRAPLASGPQDDVPEPGLLVVRVQTIVLLVVVAATGGLDRSVLVGVAVLGAIGFAAGGVARRWATRDVVQEIALVALVLAAGRLGWTPQGWEWGALAAGTLIHNLRLRLDLGSSGALAGTLLNGGGIGLPFLPVVLVGLEGSLRADDWVRLVVIACLVGGLAARSGTAPDVRPRRGPARWELAAGAVVTAAATVAGLWAPVLTLPTSVAGGEIGWPPAWAIGTVVVLGAIATLRPLSAALPSSRTERTERRSVPDLRVPARWARPGAVTGAVAALAAVSMAVWIIGVLRGFL